MFCMIWRPGRGDKRKVLGFWLFCFIKHRWRSSSSPNNKPSSWALTRSTKSSLKKLGHIWVSNRPSSASTSRMGSGIVKTRPQVSKKENMLRRTLLGPFQETLQQRLDQGRWRDRHRVKLLEPINRSRRTRKTEQWSHLNKILWSRNLKVVTEGDKEKGSELKQRRIPLDIYNSLNPNSYIATPEKDNVDLGFALAAADVAVTRKNKTHETMVSKAIIKSNQN